MTENATSKSCPQCGSPIPADAPQGLCPKCVLGTATTPTEAGQPAGNAELPPLEQVRAAFPQLEILELIGEGGMGFVYKARQPNLDRFVALKLLWPKLGADPAFAERFNREARVLARLNHANIVAVYDFGQAGGFYYLLMEYVDGVNLRQAMRSGRFSPAEALALVPGICEALQFAHEEGVLHRDIKPENILLDTRGRLKIADFGIAKLLGQARENVTLTATGVAVGTPHYMAPEQFERPQDVDQRADIYSLGVVFYEMLTGELPVGRFAPPSEKAGVDPRVDEVVLRALEREREKRYRSAGEVKTRVEDIRRTPPVAGPHGTMPMGGAPPQIAAPQAAGRTGSGASPASTAPVARWSGKAIAGAVIGAVALVPAMALLLVVPYLHFRTAAPGQAKPAVAPILGVLLVVGLAWGVPCLVGTLLGWAGLNDIRRSAGRLRGRGLALAAALYWPLLLLSLFVMFLATRFVNAAMLPGHGLALLVIPSALLLVGVFDLVTSSLVWRWSKPASDQPTSRLALPVVLCTLLVLSLPTFILSVVVWIPIAQVSRAQPISLPPPAAAANSAGRGVIADFTLPAGQVAVFEIVTRKDDQVVPVPNLAAFLITPAEEPASGTFRWRPEQWASATDERQGLWKIDIEGGGSKSSAGGYLVPDDIAQFSGEQKLWVRLEPDREVTQWASEEDETRPAVGLRIRTQAYEPKPGVSLHSAGTGTNWMQALSRIHGVSTP
jgi:predicted Ser/Thr protein kinase